MTEGLEVWRASTEGLEVWRAATEEVRPAGRRGLRLAACTRRAGSRLMKTKIPTSMPCNVRTDGTGWHRRGADGRLEGRP
jgi:hypothetical protein